MKHSHVFNLHQSTITKGNKMYKITVYNAWTGENLFTLFRHSEEEAEQCASYWWNDANDTRATYVKVW